MLYTTQMHFPVLTKIDRELLQLDPQWTSRRKWNRLLWSRSSLTSLSSSPKKPNNQTAFYQNAPLSSLKSPRYFSKGLFEKDPKQNPTPIPYLLIETQELSMARPVPGSSLFLRSLAKGKGILRKNEKGLFYLDIDNRFVLSLVPYLTRAFGLVHPPYFHLFAAPEGAHIPVILPRETAFHFIENVEDLGKEFTFEIEGLYSTQPTLWPEMEQVWFFKIHSPELEAIRQRQFLLSKPGGHSFHIAVAVKPSSSKTREPSSLPTMRINLAYVAA